MRCTVCNREYADATRRKTCCRTCASVRRSEQHIRDQIRYQRTAKGRATRAAWYKAQA